MKVMNATGRRRVLVVAFDFPPSLEIGAHACRQLTRHLPDSGWEPIVLTVQDRFSVNPEAEGRYDFPGIIVRTPALPHPLTLWAALRRYVDRTAADRSTVPYTDGAPRKGAAATLKRWVLSLLWVPDVQTGWGPVAVIAGLWAARRHRIGHVLSSGPRWTNHLVGLAVATLTRRPWTVHFRDPWLGIPQWKPVSRLSLAMEAALEAVVIRRATTVVCVTERHRQMLLERYRTLPAPKFTTIPNGFDDDEWLALPFGRSVKDEGRFVIAYVGSFYQARDPKPLFSAIRRLLDEGVITDNSIRIQLVGWCDVADGLPVRDAVRRARLESIVDFTGALPRRQALAHMAEADLLLLLAEEQPFQIPGKTYEYLRAGRPILALTKPGALADLLDGARGVAVVDPGDVEGIAAVIGRHLDRWHRAQPAECPDSDFVARFDRRRLAGELAAVLGSDRHPSTVRQASMAMSRR